MPSIIETEKTGKLGFGYMRLPTLANGEFDMNLICEMADKFIAEGGNYFDTAYVYPGAEVALRESVIKRYPRNKVLIATKLNMNHADTVEQMRTQHKTSVERLGTDYIDFYLLHGLNPKAAKKAEDLRAWDFLAELKEKGLIRHMGFSSHALPDDLDKILTNHPEAEFVQLQINYLDWENERVQSRKVYEVARKHNTPVIIMEPVKGGLLTGDSSPIASLLKGTNPDASLASWALRFAAQLDGVFVTLSGMSAIDQLNDNIKTFRDLKSLSDAEQVVLDEAVKTLNSVPRIGCTSCRYCVEGCPQKILIPTMLDIYNNYLVYNTTTNLHHSYGVWTNGRGKPEDCIACRACEEVCPQNIEIVDTLSKISKLFN